MGWASVETAVAAAPAPLPAVAPPVPAVSPPPVPAPIGPPPVELEAEPVVGKKKKLKPPRLHQNQSPGQRSWATFKLVVLIAMLGMVLSAIVGGLVGLAVYIIHHALGGSGGN